MCIIYFSVANALTDENAYYIELSDFFLDNRKKKDYSEFRFIWCKD